MKTPAIERVSARCVASGMALTDPVESGVKPLRIGMVQSNIVVNFFVELGAG